MHLDEQEAFLEREVQTRNSKYFDQQEEILYRNKLDQKAASAAKIRDYQTKEKEARRRARVEIDPLKQLEYKKEARKWEQRIETEEDRSREERRMNTERADEYLEQIEQALKGNKTIDDLLTITWDIVK